MPRSGDDEEYNPRRNRFTTWGLRMRSMVTSVVCGLLLIGSTAIAQEWPEIELVERWNGFARPVQLTHAGDGSDRLFVVEQAGRVQLIVDGQVQPVPFLDISARVECCGERGLLSVAFPPGYVVKGHFYANYTDSAGDTVVSRFRVSSDSNRADPGSEQVLLTVEQPYSNHNGGQLVFGPDGYLYIGMGDGGSAGDPQNNAQDPLELLGKMLRIDVESGEQPYGIPDSNPFAFDDGHQPEIWALGLRNPWRFSFDPGTGDLFIADVGQGSREEVNVQLASSPGGENYGWRIMEGTRCYNPDPCDATGLALPVAEYDHSQGCSVSGGHVYRGARWPRLDGLYLYGDYCSGRIWGLRRAASGWQSQQLAFTGRSISAFGTDESGALYVIDYSAGRALEVIDPDVEEVSRRVVPAVAHLVGSGGTPWRTELAITNVTGGAVNVDLAFTNVERVLDVSAVAPPGGGLVWPDVLVDLFELDPTDQASGTVQITTSVPVIAGARSYASTSEGTYGQYLPALSASDGIGPGQVGVIGQLSRSPDRYTNLGVVNLGDVPARAAVTLRSLNGDPLGEALIFDLEPGRWQQMFDVLAGLGQQTRAWARVEVLSPGGRVWAYASVIDGLSRDPTTIPMTQ